MNNNAAKWIESLIGPLSDERRQGLLQEQAQCQARKKAATQRKLIYIIPDWLNIGGNWEIWLNPDGTYETDDDRKRLSDSDIRDGIRRWADSTYPQN